MEENLEHINLIDKYLNDELNTEEQIEFERLSRKSPAFRRDLEVYQQIYKGIEAFEDDGLKNRLDKYHEAFKREKRRKQNVRKLFIAGLSTAATIVLGWFLIFKSADPGKLPIAKPEDETPKVEKLDSVKRDRLQKPTQTKEVLVEKQTDTATQDDFEIGNEPVLSLGGVIPLSQQNIKSVTYPEELSYTFDGKQLELFGDPLIPALRIQPGKTTSGAYVLRIKDDFYPIEINKKKSPLRSANLNLSVGSSNDEQIEISIRDIRPLATSSDDLKVLVRKKEGIPITYQFEKNEQKIRIFLSGNVDLNDTFVWQLNFKGKLSYYLESGEIIYELSSDATELTPPILLNFLKNDKVRLFRKRESIQKQLVTFDKLR